MPFLSISCVSYNQKPYIRACLDGFLMQKTSFPFEIIIHDDASTDGTREIIEEYVTKYPDIIFPKFQQENQYSKGVRGMMAKFNFPRCKGKYIALCEGDDYWTDPFKLQKQVDFLENNQQYGAVFTNAIVINEISDEENVYNEFLSTGEVSNEIIYKYGGGLYPTASFMLKKELLQSINLSIPFVAGDELLLFQLANKTKIYYLNEFTVAYRRWAGGIFSSILSNKPKLVSLRKNEIKGYKTLSKLLNQHNKILLRKNLINKARFIVTKSTSSLDKIYYHRYLGFKVFFKKILKRW